jgi:hypothetical protein
VKKMVIYQVQDEQNRTVGEYQNYDMALSFSQDLAAWFPDHSYHIEALVFEAINEQAH